MEKPRLGESSAAKSDLFGSPEMTMAKKAQKIDVGRPSEPEIIEEY